MLRQLHHPLYLILADGLAVGAALLLTSLLRPVLPWGRPLSPSGAAWPLGAVPLALLSWLITLGLSGAYDLRSLVRRPVPLQSLSVAGALATFAFAGAMYFTYREVSRIQVGLFIGLSFGLILAGRLALRWAWSRLEGLRPRRRLLIIGDAPAGRELAGILQAEAWTGLEVVGFLDDTPGDGVLGRRSDAVEIVNRQGIDEVVIALPADRHQELRALLPDLQRETGATIRLVPDVSPLVFARLSVEELAGIPLVTLLEPALSPAQRLAKRALDLTLGTALFIIALPVMAAVALAVWLDSGRPIIYRQPRVGEGGRLFSMYKFRTMVPDADRHLDQVIVYTPDGRPVHKRPDDPRVTRVGRFLRRWSLDELPQLVNVLKGEMSLVGPRPELPWLVERYEPWQRQRFLVPQGITGWWQVNGRSDKPMHLHTEEDLFYIRNYSLWLDIQILLRTPLAVIRRRGAF